MNRAPLVLIGLLASATHAAPFTDPFRPPRQIEPAAVDAPANASAGSRLESLLIGPDRRIAVINGQSYVEGDRFGEGRVLRISESEVVIRHADRDEKLSLFPASGKRTSTAVKGAK
jgi:MSHA biogenesis protein MshK